MVFWLAVLVGALFAWIAVQVGFYAAWTMFFHLVLAAYMAIFLTPVVIANVPAAAATSAIASTLVARSPITTPVVLTESRSSPGMSGIVVEAITPAVARPYDAPRRSVEPDGSATAAQPAAVARQPKPAAFHTRSRGNRDLARTGGAE